MPIGAGTRLGPYEILGAIGAGGMGEVYRARDTRLERHVAIKVLPEHLSANQALRERFEREAKVISGLSHPHICTLYDVGQEDGREFLVMEFVEGETLAARLERGALPPDQAIRIAASIASALDKAHRSGIVHRDLKPANVMLTREGAKLLDFGLAKLKPQPIAVAAAALTEMTTDDRKLTAEGTIVGTFQYMSPEQLEGAEADPRTDIFSLGAVLYEMVTGRAAFAGKTKASLIASILSAEPAPITTIQPASPPALDRVIRACIAKDPADRIQTAHDLRLQLELVAESGSQFALAAPGVAVRRGIPGLALVGGAVMLALLLAALGYWIGTRRPAATDAVRSSISLPEGQRLPRLSNQVIALSPDGKTLVYSAVQNSKLNLYVRRLGQFESFMVPGTEGGHLPAISPDGNWIAFIGRERKLYKVRVDGGAVLKVSDRADLVGLEWGADDRMYFSIWAQGIYSISADGGDPKPITKTGTSQDDRSHVWPQLLPGGKHLLFTTWTGKSFDDARLEVVELASGQRTVVANGGTYGRYIPTQHLVYARGGVLLAQAFDLDAMRTTGPPFPVVEGVHTGAANGEARFAVSSDGTLVYVPGTFTPVQHELVAVDRSGKATRLTEQLRPYADVQMSPDGSRVVATLEMSTFDVWMLDLRRDTLSKLTFGADDSDSLWSPDGKSLVYTSTGHGQPDLFLKRLDSNDPPRQLTNDAAWDMACCWQHDGALIFSRAESRDNADIWALPMAGEGRAHAVLATSSDERPTSTSPDGKWLTYTSNRSGRTELYVQSLTGAGREWQISRDGADGGWWLPNGREILFGIDDAVWSVKLASGDELDPSRPTKLFDVPGDSSGWNSVSVTPDGRLLVAREVVRASEQADIRLVQNWFSELRSARR